jgi:hypothetical protein
MRSEVITIASYHDFWSADQSIRTSEAHKIAIVNKVGLRLEFEDKLVNLMQISRIAKLLFQIQIAKIEAQLKRLQLHVQT